MEFKAMTNTIWLLLSVGILHYCFYFVLRKYQIDAFRERLFSLRDEMFRYAQEGNIEFDHPAYGYLRRTINSMIRGAHRYDPARIFIIWASIKLSANDKFLAETQKEMDESIESISEENARKAMNEFRNKMLRLAIRQIFIRSRFLMLLYFALIVILFSRAILKDIHKISIYLMRESFYLLKESLFNNAPARDFIEQEARLRSRAKVGMEI